jgi:hypothetical protein
VLKHSRCEAGDLAEIIPVEPEQDNACAGKVASFFFLRFAFSNFSASLPFT